MYRLAVPFAAALLLGAAARADDAEARKVVDAAIKAHGGAETLAKSKDKATIMKGKMKIAAMDLDATLEMHSGDKKFKQEVKLSINGMDITVVTVFNGKEMWTAVNGMIMNTIDKKEDLDKVRQQMASEETLGLMLLGSKDVELSLIGDSTVEDTPVVGVRVSRKGHQDVNVYFDKKSHLMRKMEFRGVDFQTQAEVQQERIVSDYKDVDGQKRPSKVAVLHDGKKVVDIEFTDISYVDKLDDGTFDKPK